MREERKPLLVAILSGLTKRGWPQPLVALNLLAEVFLRIVAHSLQSLKSPHTLKVRRLQGCKNRVEFSIYRIILLIPLWGQRSRGKFSVSKPTMLLQEPHASRALLFIFGGRQEEIKE